MSEVVDLLTYLLSPVGLTQIGLIGATLLSTWKAYQENKGKVVAQAETTEAIALLSGDVKDPTAAVEVKIPGRAYTMNPAVKSWILYGEAEDVRSWIIRQINEAEVRGYTHYILVGDDEAYYIEWGGLYGLAHGVKGQEGYQSLMASMLGAPADTPLMYLIVPRYAAVVAPAMATVAATTAGSPQ